MIYVRWRCGESRRGRVFEGPGTQGYLPCPACRLRLDTWPTDPRIQLIVVGPEPGDEEAEQRHAAGRWYTATAVPLHETCAMSSTDADLDTLINQLVIVSPDQVNIDSGSDA